MKIWSNENAANAVFIATVKTNIKFPIYSGKCLVVLTCQIFNTDMRTKLLAFCDVAYMVIIG